MIKTSGEPWHFRNELRVPKLKGSDCVYLLTSRNDDDVLVTLDLKAIRRFMKVEVGAVSDPR